MAFGSARKGAPLAALLVLFLLAAPARSADVIGFYTCYNSCIGEVTRDMGNYLTQVNLFNYAPNSWGGLSGYGFSSSTVSSIKSTGVKKVFMTVGGAGTDAEFRSAVTSNRTALVNSIVSKARELGVDGVDIDWEYPNASGSDPANFIAFLQQLKSALSGKKLSIDVGTTKYLDPPFKAGSALYDHVDYVNVMNYDDWCAAADPNHSSFMKSYRNMQDGWRKAVPDSKLVLGVPFYGRSLTGSSGCSETGTPYSSIWAASDDADEAGGVYFNGPVTMRDKGLYAKNAGFAGVMFWQIGQDKSDNTLLKALHAGLNSTSYSGDWRPGVEYFRTPVRHDGKWWLRSFAYAVDVEPHQGSHNVLQFWKMSDEPFCDELWTWNAACAYAGPRDIERDNRCFELPAGATAVAGRDPLAGSPWQEFDCSPCASKQDGGPWFNSCTYSAGERVYHKGYFWRAARDVGDLGVGTPPGFSNDYYWTLEQDGSACLPADFDAEEYARLNPSAAAAAGTGRTALARHYLNTGRAAELGYTTGYADRHTGMPICPAALPADFSVEGYRLSNCARLAADGAYDDEELLRWHYAYWGAAEGLPYDGSSAVAPRAAAAGSPELGFASRSGIALRNVRGEVRVEAVGIDGRAVRSARASAADGTVSFSWEPLRPGLWIFRVRHAGGESLFRRALVD